MSRPKREFGNFQVTRFCCVSHGCAECRGRADRQRVVQGWGYSKTYAEFVAGNWARYGATVEEMIPPRPAPGPKPATVTLHYFEFVISNLGVWDRCWALTAEGLETERELLRDMNSKIDDEITPDDKLDGGVGQNSAGRTVEVALTPEGLLAFAQQYAIDIGAT